MKDSLWAAMVKAVSFLPDKVVSLSMRLMSSALASRRNAERGLVMLLKEHRSMRNKIDEAAIRYEGGIHPKHRLMAYHKFFTSRVEPGMSLLDVGCGYGAVAHSLAIAGARVTGIDINRANIEKAKSRWSHGNLTFVEGDATKSLPSGTYDVVVLSNVLEHIENRVGFLRSLRQSAQPKKWLIRVPLVDRDWLVPMAKEVGVQHFSDPTHFTEYTASSFVSEMNQSGLKVDYMSTRWGEIWAELIDA